MKLAIYQVLVRLFGNDNNHCIHNGSLAENGVGKLADFTPAALKAIKELGVNCIWYTGVIEHATRTDYRKYNIAPDHPAIVKGNAGSPYAIKDYYDIAPDLAMDVPGRMLEFEALVARTHEAGLKCIIDFVPNHVARQYQSDAQPDGSIQLGANDDVNVAFSPYNNFYYIPGQRFSAQFDLRGGAESAYYEEPAKATGNDRFDACPTISDWYETVKLNYGVDYANGGVRHFDPRPDTWDKMLDILLFWASKGVDGFRCDMAEMVPVEFWEWAIAEVKRNYPGMIFIAEVYDPQRYRDYILRGGFDYLYDKVGLYDTLREVMCGRMSATEITPCWQRLNGIEDRMLTFLENHDEQRIASQFFAADSRLGIPAMAVAALMSRGATMLYFGQELGEAGMQAEGYSGMDGRTTIFDYWSVDTIRRWRNKGTFNESALSDNQRELRQAYGRLLSIAAGEPAVTEGKFFDLMYANLNGWRFNEHKQYAFLRKHESSLLLVVANFDSVPADVAINIPAHAFDYMGIPPIETIEAIDLMTNQTETSGLLPYKATNVVVRPFGVKVLSYKV